MHMWNFWIWLGNSTSSLQCRLCDTTSCISLKVQTVGFLIMLIQRQVDVMCCWCRRVEPWDQTDHPRSTYILLSSFSPVSSLVVFAVITPKCARWRPVKLDQLPSCCYTVWCIINWMDFLTVQSSSDEVYCKQIDLMQLCTVTKIFFLVAVTHLATLVIRFQ